MDHGIYISLFAIGLFLGMLILLEVGRRIGARRLAEDPKGAEAGVGTVEGAVFALRSSWRFRFTSFDIEYPRLGFIRVDAFDQALVELRETMK
jgi:hypothetical protein